MKVLVLDCINSIDYIETQKALGKFIDGINTGGGDVTRINVNDLDIKPCYSCTSQSSFEYDEKCRCEDDMNKLYPLFRESQSWVFATHVNSNNSVDYLKNLLDRMEPLFQPIYLLDSTSATLPPDNKIDGRMILLCSYEKDSENSAKKISDYIDSISMLFSKVSFENILFDVVELDPKMLELIFSAGKSFAGNGTN